MKSLIIILSLVFIVSSCKTQEQIRREQMVDSLSIQMTEGQKLNADTLSRIQNLEDNLNSISGQIDQKNHNTIKTTNERLANLESRVSLVEEQNKELKAEVSSQKSYINEVLKSLKKIAPSSSSKKKLSPYKQALSDYKRGRYNSAKSAFLVLADDKKIKGSKKARIYHNLGMIYYMQKNYNSALIHFSKLFTTFPKSGYNKNGLLHLGKSFQKLKKDEEAKQTFSQLIESFPKSKSAKTAKTLLKKMK